MIKGKFTYLVRRLKGMERRWLENSCIYPGHCLQCVYEMFEMKAEITQIPGEQRM